MTTITLPSAPHWPVVSQHPNVAPAALKRYAELHYLPRLVKLWQAVEEATGYKWRCTSYWRKSPSHVTGSAIDIAPDIAPASESRYAVSNMSDPVLYKRVQLIRDLQDLALDWPYDDEFIFGIFIEPDHLHMQMFTRRPTDTAALLVVKWKVPKPIYSDTMDRMKLPMI